MFEGYLPGNEEQVPWQPRLDVWWIPGPWLTCVKISFSTSAFHVTTYNELIHLSRKKKSREKRKRRVLFSFSASVVAAASLDGCVCQGGRACSLMMAMSTHKRSPADACMHVCVCVILQDGWSACVALTANQSTSAQLTCLEAQYPKIQSHTQMHFWTFETNKKHDDKTVVILRQRHDFRILPRMPERSVPVCWKGFRLSPWQQTDWWLGHSQCRPRVRPSCFSHHVHLKLWRQTG